MTTKSFGVDDFARAVTRSRSLHETAIDMLCEVIAEVTGRAPLRERVAFVATFWVMHACDREVYGQPRSVHDLVVVPDPPYPSDRRFRSDVVSLVGSREAPVRIVDPYLKTTFSDEWRAAMRGRRQLRWQSVARPKVRTRTVLSDRRLAFAAHCAKTDGPDDLLRRAIALTAPMDVVEQHHELTEWAQSVTDPRAKVCYSANAHQSSESFRHQLYEQRLVGSKIVFHQHGGGNGIDEHHPGEFHDTTLGDVFYTWGWQRPDLGRRVRPLPTALPARDEREPSRRYLLMSLPVTSHFYRFQPFLVPHHVERAVSETVAFANELSEDSDLCVRSSGADEFPMHELSGTKARLSTDDPSTPGALSATRSRLVLHNYLGTTWLETLALDVPTVCFYDPAVFRPRESARPYFDVLRRVGVIHHSGAEAARFVNQLNGDPSAWWNSADVQEAREAFVARYANFSEDWLQAWTDEFERLLAE